MSQDRRLRRMAGFFAARLPELDFGQVLDPRHRRGRRWALSQLLQTTLLGLMSGCKSLKQVEQLSQRLATTSRRLLSVTRRVADTTLRDSLCRVCPTSLRAALHRCILAAWRRKALEPFALPFGVIAMDGKGTALPSWDDDYAQRVIHEETKTAYGHLRTMTATLVSALGRPCIDAVPIPASTNEMGQFEAAFLEVNDTYNKLFRLVSYDAGAASEHNASVVISAKKDYLFRLNDERRHMQQFAAQVLADKPDLATTTDVLDNHTSVTRSVKLSRVLQVPTAKDTGLVWRHAKTLLSVRSVKTVDGKVAHDETRYYVSSLRPDELRAGQWLRVVREHWAVEVTHNALDVVFAEDDHPFITYSPQGALVVMLLRRIAYTMLTLFRSVTLRSESQRQTPWQHILDWVSDALIALRPEHVTGLRLREPIAFV